MEKAKPESDLSSEDEYLLLKKIKKLRRKISRPRRERSFSQRKAQDGPHDCCISGISPKDFKSKAYPKTRSHPRISTRRRSSSRSESSSRSRSRSPRAGRSVETVNDIKDEEANRPQNIANLDCKGSGQHLLTCEEITSEISKCWLNITRHGLDENSRTLIIGGCTTPSFRAPEMNAEVKACVKQLAQVKDNRIERIQDTLGAALERMNKVIAMCINAIEPAKNIIKSLSEIGGLISDVHYKESLIRRYLLINELKPELKDTLYGTEIGSLLFGEGLGEKVKAAEELEKTVSVLKKPKRQTKRPFKKKFPFKDYRKVRKAKLNHNFNNRTDIPSDSVESLPDDNFYGKATFSDDSNNDVASVPKETVRWFN